MTHNRRGMSFSTGVEDKLQIHSADRTGVKHRTCSSSHQFLLFINVKTGCLLELIQQWCNHIQLNRVTWTSADRSWSLEPPVIQARTSERWSRFKISGYKLFELEERLVFADVLWGFRLRCWNRFSVLTGPTAFIPLFVGICQKRKYVWSSVNIWWTNGHFYKTLSGRSHSYS